MQLGVKLPHTGDAVADGSVHQRARTLEAAGFDSLWVSDHIALPSVMASPYPFAADGKATWPSDTPYLETVVVLAAAAATTKTVRLGTAVLVIPQRNPLLLAKQLASVAHLAGNRLEIGVGAGWLREEFEALQAPFDGRGERTEEWVQLMRSCWTGRPTAWESRNYRLPGGLYVLPTPPAPIPVYVGGHSSRALRRAATLGDGWLGQQSALSFDVDLLAREISVIRTAALEAGRNPGTLRVVLRVVDSAGRADRVAAGLRALAKAGVNEVITDVDPTGDPVADHAVLRDAAASL